MYEIFLWLTQFTSKCSKEANCKSQRDLNILFGLTKKAPVAQQEEYIMVNRMYILKSPTGSKSWFYRKCFWGRVWSKIWARRKFLLVRTGSVLPQKSKFFFMQFYRFAGVTHRTFWLSERHRSFKLMFLQ